MKNTTTRAKKPLTPVTAVIAVAGVVVGVLVTVTAVGAGLVPTLVTLVAGIAYGALIFAFPPRNRAVAIGALLLVPLVLIAIVALKDVVGSVQYAWIFGVIAGGVFGGYSWRSMPRRREAGMRSPKRSKNNLIVAAIVLGPLILGVGLFVVAPTAHIQYDETHQTDVTCTVTSAEGGVRSSVSRIGAGSSRAQVEIRTDDCGVLRLQEGVTEDNSAEIAARLTPGGHYVFTIGEGSWSARGAFELLGKSPLVYGYAPATRGP
jgi:hypothetical protein